MKTTPYIKVRLTEELKETIKFKSQKVGLTSGGYLKYLAMKDAMDNRELQNLYIIENIEDFRKLVNKLNLWKSARKSLWLG